MFPAIQETMDRACMLIAIYQLHAVKCGVEKLSLWQMMFCNSVQSQIFLQHMIAVTVKMSVCSFPIVLRETDMIMIMQLNIHTTMNIHNSSSVHCIQEIRNQ